MEKRKAQSKVAELVNMIEYQETSVVSRTLIDKRTGTMTLFAFDEGQGLSEHTAPYDAMVLIVDGEADVTISGKVYRLKTGEMIMLPTDAPHSLKARTRFKMLLTMIKS